MKTIVSFFCVCIIIFGCSKTPKVDISKDVETLRLIEEQWVEAAKAGDIDKILNWYAPNSVDMAYNVPVSLDLQARRKAIESWFMTIDLKSIKNTTDDIQVSSSGDLAFTRGTGYQKSTDRLTEYSGRWVSIYKKIDGNWKVIVNIDHNDNPRPLQTEITKGLNQVELMKQFAGSWKAEIGKDTIVYSDEKSFGTGSNAETSFRVVTKGKIIFEGKTVSGYDKNIDKFISTEITKAKEISVYTYQFTSDKKYEILPYDFSNPSKTSWKAEGEFKSPDVFLETTIENGKPPKTITFTRVK